MSSLPTLKQARIMIWLLTGVLVALFFLQIPFHLANIPYKELMNNDGGIYEASATILALVGFGSTIGVKISANKQRASIQWMGLSLVYGSSALVILAQTLIMTTLCCLGLYELFYMMFMMLTSIALLLMLLGYFALALQQQTEEDVDATFRREAGKTTESVAPNVRVSECPTNRDRQSQHDSKAPVPWRGLRY